MQVRCVSDSAQHLPAGSPAYNPDGLVQISLGAHYKVVGMSLYADVLMILISDDTRLPNWYPIALFDVEEPQLPSFWLFTTYGPSNHLQAIWGYDDLVRDESHYDRLLERDTGALSVFLKWARRSEDEAG